MSINTSQENGTRLFSVVPNDTIRGCGHKLKHRKISLSIRKYFFTVSVTEHWQSLPREVVEFPPWKSLSLETFRNRMDMVLATSFR